MTLAVILPARWCQPTTLAGASRAHRLRLIRLWADCGSASPAYLSAALVNALDGFRQDDPDTIREGLDCHAAIRALARRSDVEAAAGAGMDPERAPSAQARTGTDPSP